MKKQMAGVRKCLSFALAVCMCLGLLQTPVRADGTAKESGRIAAPVSVKETDASAAENGRNAGFVPGTKVDVRNFSAEEEPQAAGTEETAESAAEEPVAMRGEEDFDNAIRLSLNTPYAIRGDLEEDRYFRFTADQPERYSLRSLTASASCYVFDENRSYVGYYSLGGGKKSKSEYADVALDAGETCYFDISWLSQETEIELSVLHDYEQGVCRYCGKKNLVLNAEAAAGGSTAIDDGFLPEYSDGTFQMIPNKKRGGVYFLQETSLKYVDLATGLGYEVYRAGDSANTFVQGSIFYELRENSVIRINLDNGEELSQIRIDTALGEDADVTAIGADPSGRLYIALSLMVTEDGKKVEHNRIHLFAADGKELSVIDLSDIEVYKFLGFESSGNFYFEGYYNWVYWGYDHPGRAIYNGRVAGDELEMVDVGNNAVVSGLIQYDLGCLEYICQSWYNLHERGGAVFGDRYLVTVSNTFDRIQVIDTKTDKICFTANRAGDYTADDGDYNDTGSVGVRAGWNAARGSLIIYDDSLLMKEYAADTGKELGRFRPAHPVFEVGQADDELYLLEKEGGVFYLERVEWKEPDHAEISGKAKMRVRTSQQLTLDTGAPYVLDTVWTSSDASVATVTKDGIVSAFREGTAVISANVLEGRYTAQFKVTVVEDKVAVPDTSVKTANGRVTDNLSLNNYVTYGSTVTSYLEEQSDGSFGRVEYTGDGKILTEVLEADGSLRSSGSVKAELEIFGGFYSGETYNFLVFGKQNPKDSETAEVLRIVRYGKDWARQESLSVKGANTFTPFDAGSLRMTETGGKLYIHTCHEMFMSDDGYHHQANMTFVVDEDTMTMADQNYEVMNFSQGGYVSHSFNQFIAADENYVYRVDHGDAYPRAVTISRCAAGGSIEEIIGNYAWLIEGSTGYNTTGVSVGGLALSKNNVLVVGNSVTMDDAYSADGQRNIFVSVLDRDLNLISRKTLTSYGENSGITVRTPQLVQLGDYQFLLLWEEVRAATGKIVVKAAKIDEEGNLAGEPVAMGARLSDCQPILTKDGLVAWYVTDGASLQLYTIHPYDLSGNNLGEPKTKISAATVTVKNVVYTGKKRSPAPTVKLNGVTLKKGTDYTVSYKNNIEAGKASLIITGIGDFTGSIKKYFQITPKAITITAAGRTVVTKTKKQTVKLGAAADGGTLSYALKTEAAGAKVSAAGTLTVPANYVGKLSVVISAEGKNYKPATKTVTVTVSPAPVTVRKIVNKAEKSMALQWTRNAKADGYQIQYSTTSGFSKSKKILLSGNETVKYTIAGLTAKKTYYVRVRAYKTVKGTKYPSAWSEAVSVKIVK